MPICFIDILDRRWIQHRPDVYWVFGDNKAGAGLGGQAAACRGEPNAIGVPTKKRPSMDPDAFCTSTDDAFDMIEAFVRIEEALMKGAIVAVPTAGVGTGLSRLNQTCPELYQWIREQFIRLVRAYGRTSPDGAGLGPLMARRPM